MGGYLIAMFSLETLMTSRALGSFALMNFDMVLYEDQHIQVVDVCLSPYPGTMSQEFGAKCGNSTAILSSKLSETLHWHLCHQCVTHFVVVRRIWKLEIYDPVSMKCSSNDNHDMHKIDSWHQKKTRFCKEIIPLSVTDSGPHWPTSHNDMPIYQ